MKIGNVELTGNVILAPMAGVCNSAFRKICKEMGASLVCADGAGVVWGAKKAGLKIREKAAGVEILEEVVKRSSESKLKIFLLGAKPGTAEKAKENLKNKYPNCNIVGSY